MDDEEKEREDKRDELQMLNKRLEKYFFEKRSVYLWGVVDDKSAKEIVSKLLLL
jgi:ATP-dependent Clp protease protease subunit